MSLKNYTSTVPATRSITFIEQKLSSSGAKAIMKYYDDQQRVANICFSIKVDGVLVPFKLPCRIDQCEKVLRSYTTSRTRSETLKKIPKQAERTAWKILADWVDAQMSMIELSQIDILEVFMPYMFDGEQTFYERIKDTGYKAMLPERFPE